MSTEIALSTILLRAFGAVVGVLCVLVGCAAVLLFDEIEFTKRIAGGVSIFGAGIYFINYAVTGRRFLRGRSPL
jgi:hypothetical protein